MLGLGLGELHSHHQLRKYVVGLEIMLGDMENQVLGLGGSGVLLSTTVCCFMNSRRSVHICSHITHPLMASDFQTNVKNIESNMKSCFVLRLFFPRLIWRTSRTTARRSNSVMWPGLVHGSLATTFQILFKNAPLTDGMSNYHAPRAPTKNCVSFVFEEKIVFCISSYSDSL